MRFIMNRLPGCDRATARSEFAVFASLGFAGVLMVALVAAQATSHGVSRGRISAGLETVSPSEGNRAIAIKVGAPINSPAALSDPCRPTRGMAQGTQG